ncbi:MAG: saccharopine dehydrogenase family protein [Pseudomonadota bacterium]
MSDQSFQVVVFGATSFVGQIICQYLTDTYGVDGEVKWAAAGRNLAKLEKVKASLGSKAAALPLLQADANDPGQLADLCKQTDVVLSTVGPYALYGEPMVKACVDTGTDYVDLTGETPWIRAMLLKYEAKAKETGARIVNCCGFDSIPSDLGVHFLQKQAQAQFGAPCTRVKMRVKAAKGAMSGGTVASMLNIAQEAAKDKALRKELANPYSLCIDNAVSSVRQPDVKSATFDKDFGVWLAPFVMAAINTRVVHRSNALLDGAYGTDFAYDEAMITGKGTTGWLTAQSITAAMGGFLVAAVIKPARWLMEKTFLPAPGEGPSPEAQEKGFYDIRFHGVTTKGEELRAKVTGDRDPGYGSTSKMISEAALCLATETPRAIKGGGFWTPATALGDNLIQRLEARAGVHFSSQ